MPEQTPYARERARWDFGVVNMARKRTRERLKKERKETDSEDYVPRFSEDTSRFRPPYLFEQFAQWLPRRADRVAGSQVPLTRDQKLYILFRESGGAGPTEIASMLNVTPRAVSRVLREAWANPGQFLDLGFVIPLNLGRTKRSRWYYCRLCAEMGEQPGLMADHAFGHCWDEEELET